MHRLVPIYSSACCFPRPIHVPRSHFSSPTWLLPSSPSSRFLVVPTVVELEGTDNSVYLEMLRLFAHGTWSDYKSNSGSFPQLVPDQVLKLKQPTVLTLVETNKVLPYDQLMLELDVTNVRELEDFLINECMYTGIVRGKLDQLRRCFLLGGI